jgi:tetratricopeptide (TPR) repeat protein
MVRNFGLDTRRGCARFAVIAVGLVAGAVAGVLIWRGSSAAVLACEREARAGHRPATVRLCLDAHRDTGDERALYWAAKADVDLGEIEEADRLLHRLSSRALDGEARRLLGYIASREGRYREAQLQAILASAAFMAAGQWQGLARDEVLMSQVARHLGDFTAALVAADLALTLATRLGDSHAANIAYIARADALSEIGDIQGACDTLATAEDCATEPCDRTWDSLRHGTCLMDLGQDDLARPQLSAAARANERCDDPNVWVQILSNQAWLLRKRDPAAALVKLDDLRRRKRGDESVDTLMLRGYIAADRGALDDAADFVTQAETLDGGSAEWSWEIARVRGELFEQRGGALARLLAEYEYRRSNAMVAALRARSPAGSAFLVSQHRWPYDGLIALLARERRWRDALAVVLDLDASDMLRATAVEHTGAAPDPPDPGASALRPVVIPPSVEAVLSAWRGRDMVIVVAQSSRQIGAGNERVYRLQVSDGEVRGEDVGDARTARGWAKALFEDPDNREAARALGRVMIPPGSSARAMHVLAIGALGKVPLAALRDDDGSLIIGRRPLVRVLALRATRRESRGAGSPVVIADPRGDLAGAAVEGSVVARAVGAEAQVSGSRSTRRASRAELWAANDAALLHIAGHVISLGRRRVLPVADGEVGPAEILQHGLAPRLAVVASCGSAAATDEEGWGSIASALLEAGTAAVVATDRRVDDGATLEMMRAFYAQPDWRADPARALARVQAHDAAAGAAAGAATAQTWAAFSVLGRPPYIE